jgi:pimeloyl-ACP methyl ester carboxylesterase
VRAFDQIGERLAGPAIERTMAIAGPLLQTGGGAGIIRAGIQYEAFLREQQEHCSTLLSFATGYHTTQQRWARSEHVLRRQLAPHRSVPRSGGPHVFWHGPDRVTAPDRPVVVLVNGWTASGLLWPAKFVDQLENAFDVVRVDNRGTGYSRTAPAPFTMTQLADDVRDVLGAIGARSATIVGLSMGGMIAQELAIRHPDVVERLVLCGTRPPPPAGFAPARSVLAAMTAMPRRTESLGAFFTRTWGAVAGSDFREQHAEGMHELIEHLRARPTPRAGVINQLRAIAGWSGAARLERITAPTVVLHGAEDPLIPVGNGMRLAQLIPDATYVELPRVGHLVPYEAPDALLAAITSSRRGSPVGIRVVPSGRQRRTTG